MENINKYPESEVRIRFEHCDPFGHLNNVRYLEYIQHERTEHLRNFYGFDVFDYAAKTGRNWVAGRTQIVYRNPVKYNETVILQTRLLSASPLRIIPEAVMLSADRRRIHALAWIEFFHVNLETGRPARHDAELMGFLNSLVTGDGDIAAVDFDARLKELTASLKERETVPA